jgi:hypothetical protein
MWLESGIPEGDKSERNPMQNRLFEYSHRFLGVGANSTDRFGSPNVFDEIRV